MVGQFRQARLVRLGAFQQADDGRQAAVVAKGADLDGQRPLDVQGTAGDGVAGLAWMGQVLAGEQRLVDTGLAVEDHSVGRQHGAWRYQYAVADAQFAEQDALALVGGVQAQAGRRQQVDQLRGGGGGALPRAAFEVAAGEEEQGEHADRVEIQLALAGDRRPDAGDVGAADRQRHRDVHGQVAGAQVAQGATEELAAAVEDDRRGEDQADPAQDAVHAGGKVEVEFRPGRHHRHHHLDPQQPGDTELAQGVTVLHGQALGGAVGLVGMAGIADLAQFAEQLAERQLAVLPAHVQAMVGQVEPRLGYARQLAQVLLDQPAAGGATDAFDHQAGFRQLALMADEAALYVRAVVELQLFAERLGQGFGIGGVFAAVPVVAFQAAGDDGLGHRLAARTAHGPRLAEHAGLEAAAGGDRQAAVVAGQGGAHGRFASAPWSGSSPSSMTTVGDTTSSSKRRHWPLPSWPSSSTKRRPSTASVSCPT